MPITVEEVAQQIDSFLEHISQRYIIQFDQQELVPNQLDHNLIREEFKKVIFSDQKECLGSITKLPINLAIEAQKLRLLRIGAELDLANTKYFKINSDCFNELLNALEFGNISENLKNKFAYVSLAYYLSYAKGDVTHQQTLKFFTDTRTILQQGHTPRFLTIDYEFLKLYYSFSMVLSSLAPKDTEVHKIYGDLPLDDRLKDGKFSSRINCLISGLIPNMTWLDVQDKIAVITAYSIISKSCYEKDEFCEPDQLKKALDFVTVIFDKKATELSKAREAARERIEQACKARQDLIIRETEEKVKLTNELMEAEIARINAHWDAVLQQQISNINSAIAQAKRDAHSRAFRNTLTQAVGIAAGCFVGPAACGALGVAAGAPTLITSAAISGATQAAITGGNFGDILKSAAIGGITGSVMSKVPVSSGLTGAAARIEGAKLGVLNSAVSTAASVIVRGEGKLDPAAMLGAGLAGANGVDMKGLTKDLTERAIKDTTTTAIHGGKLVPNLANGAIEGAAGYFGKTMGEELKSKIEADRALSRPELVLEESPHLQEGSEQGKEAKRKAKGKDRVEDDEAKQKVLDKTKLRQERNLRWMKRLESANPWSLEVEAQPILLQEQKEQLKLKILTDLKMRAYLQANLQGVDFELNKIASLIIKRIDAMDQQSLTKLDKEYDFYQLQPQEFRQFKVIDAVFENSGCSKEAKNPIELSQTPQKSFWQRFKENYVATILEQDQQETALCRAQAEETLRLLQKYRVGTRAVGALEILGGSAQIGAAGLLMETGIGAVPGTLLLARGADHLVAGAHTFVSGEHTDTVLHQTARKVGFSSGAATVLEVVSDFGLGIGSNLSLKGLDLARTPKTLTFQHDAKMANTTQNTLSSTVHSRIAKTETSVIKGLSGEAAQMKTMQRAGYESLPCKINGNQGFDGVYIKRTTAGEIDHIVIAEAKYAHDGVLRLGNTSVKGTVPGQPVAKQMGPKWVQDTLLDMASSADSQVKATAHLIMENDKKLIFRANVLDPQGVNRWKKPTEIVQQLHQDIIQQRAPPPTPNP